MRSRRPPLERIPAPRNNLRRKLPARKSPLLQECLLRNNPQRTPPMNPRRTGGDAGVEASAGEETATEEWPLRKRRRPRHTLLLRELRSRRLNGAYLPRNRRSFPPSPLARSTANPSVRPFALVPAI